MSAPEHRWLFLARVRRVIDGDTVDLEIDQGMHARRVERVRLLDVDTPEVRGVTAEAGMIAKAFVVSWFAQVFTQGPIGEFPFVVETEKADSFGRFLARIWNRQTGESLADALITAKQAVAR